MFCNFNESIINTKILINYFKEMCRKFTPPYRDECVSINQNKAEINCKIISFLSEIRRLVSEKKCDIETFRLNILNINEANLLHLEILWYLEKYNLLHLHEVIEHYERVKNEAVIEHISQRIIDTLTDYKSNESVLKRKMMISYMKAVFGNLQNNMQLKEIKCSLQYTVLDFIARNVGQIYNSDEIHSFPLTKNINFSEFMSLVNEAELKSCALNCIYETIIESILEGSPITVKNLFKTQEKLQSKLKEERIYQFFLSVSKFCELNSLTNLLKIKLLEKSKAVNWINTLVFIGFIGSNYMDGWKKLKTLCDCLLQEAFKKLDVKLMASAFLIARQGCFEKSKNAFPNYGQWFASSFSSKSTTCINSTEVCLFFFDFLSDLVEIDSVKYLKIHINKTPAVPADCLPILNDYVTLVKKQLSDLNASSELGICENATDKGAAAFDVECIIKHFETTNTILNSVFEAAIFNRNYFEKKLLVELLSKFDGKNSARHKVIQKLNTLGKIPKSAFNKYKMLEKNKKS